MAYVSSMNLLSLSSLISMPEHWLGQLEAVAAVGQLPPQEYLAWKAAPTSFSKCTSFLSKLHWNHQSTKRRTAGGLRAAGSSAAANSGVKRGLVETPRRPAARGHTSEDEIEEGQPLKTAV